MIFLLTLLAVLTVILNVINYIAPVLFIVFLILKLCGVILWSWFLVCLPIIIFGVSLLIRIVLAVVSVYLETK